MNTVTNVLNMVYQVSYFIMPLFIVLLVFNSGMSEHPRTILSTVRHNWSYFLRLILLNNLLIPLGLWLILRLMPIESNYAIGLMILFLCAGASTVIAFVQATHNQTVFAVSSMILLTLSTVVFLPILLPFMIEGAEITSFDLVGSLVSSILLPLSAGSVMRLLFTDLSSRIRPYALKLQKTTMTLAIYGMMIGLLPELISLIGSGVIVSSIGIVAVASVIGFVMEYSNTNEAMRITSGFTSGQRNGAVAYAVVINNFSDPSVLLTIAVATTISTVVFSMLSNYMGKVKLEEAR
ncbi:MAG: hypothetical protein JJU01_01740 [Alkalibacterium sp.]|nr:hypothetical protein [Alkalibacterium sp.]TVP91495.1 MAG: hypothetical protein EA249_04960 [Alkalibacterium sp.]